jgi:hypothetical protein
VSAVATAGAPALDHVGFVGSALPRLEAAMRRLGFSTTAPRELMRVDAATGAPVSLQQWSCHAVFGRGYLELSAVVTDDPGHHLAAYRARGDGLHILALGSDDPDADWRRCGAAGLPCTAPADASRRIEYGTRHGEARFRWFMLQPQASPEGLLCFARNLTPALVFQPEVSRHPNGVEALCEVVVQVESPAAAAARFAGVTGVEPRADGEGVLRFALAGGDALTLASPQALQRRFGDAAVQGVARGRFVALQLRVAQLSAAEAWLRAAGVACERRGAELVVPAREACGAVLALRE